MDIIKSIEILEALASGVSPFNGEKLDSDSILNDRDVIRALQIALVELNRHLGFNDSVSIDEAEIFEASDLFKKHLLNPTASRLTSFFLGLKKYRIAEFNQSPLYGKYKSHYSKGHLIDFFNSQIEKINLILYHATENRPWRAIMYFRTQSFNNLSEKSIQKLKKQVVDLGLQKHDKLPDYVLKARKKHFRSHEPWTDAEIDLLSECIMHTNDLALLSKCFGRSRAMLEAVGQKILYEKNQISSALN